MAVHERARERERGEPSAFPSLARSTRQTQKKKKRNRDTSRTLNKMVASQNLNLKIKIPHLFACL